MYVSNKISLVVYGFAYILTILKRHNIKIFNTIN